jgi:AraC family transcriptional regulator of adaptative response/methylated-DNA-[protein]-cysteine methyltransferase
MQALRRQTASFHTPDERWLAVTRRNADADGVFFYSVSTTGVYCRPSCGARLPRREHVAFHDSADAAEKAGFRACRRCRPRDRSLSDRHAAAIAAACRTIERHEGERMNSTELARSAKMSRFHFDRVFKRETGLTPTAYAAAVRARRVRAALARTSTVTDAIYEAGYSSSSRFYEKSHTLLGVKPAVIRAGGKGMTIRFAVGECSLGSILVAETSKGICAVFLGDDPDRLARELQDRFPKANFAPADAPFAARVAQVIAFVEEPRLGLRLPLDIRGTAFQQRVWDALTRVPAGTSATYAEIAHAIGAPRAVRAVAQACAANPVAVAIPCHRIVRTDGRLSGYRWGVERKQALRDREGSSLLAPGSRL